MTWISRNGIVITDRVPQEARRAWVRAGHCPDRDLHSLFRDRVRDHPDRPAVVDDRGTITYAELDARVRGLAGALAARPGDVVGVRVPNGRDAVVAELAVAACGAVALPFTGGRADALNLLTRARAASVITDDDLPWPTVPPRARAEGWHPVTVDPESPARLLVSSGSEAEPKLVAYSHNAFAGGRGNYLRAVHQDTPVWRDLVLVPLASAYGSFGATITLCRFGGTLLLHNRFDTIDALRTITEHRPTHVFGVPTMLRRLADHAPDFDTSSLRAVVSSGDVLPEHTLHQCRDRFGVDVINVYGSSDGVNCHTTTPEHGAGHPDPAVTDIRIVDDEICALGPMTPLDHIGGGPPRLPGGWIRTGDQGRMDDNGTLHVLRRIKRVIIRGGQTISPAEVESALTTHPAIADAACVPLPDHDLGQRLCACITLHPNHPPPNLTALTTFLLTTHDFTPHKLPEHLLVLPQLPLSHTGKVCLRTLTNIATTRLT
ncbi:class I adenylate-forming enzyme family protein [Umezawaea endophytica]|uniref:Acyl--CoA ligase n=1 Tax=Umezawaea endophytica TaxID=1654476 RepID=A0A9X3A2L1_9PSEU|nr:class I adenylate-forming enzyme family protein [Umezawaea endophytica]MCS7479188.1 acyl--CoA ligase [Umezawaea endophytica]